ncbi:integration host factor subunit alpha [Marinomonas piezotolerans]|uniref:Integration host factor subunit alpha n=1 Tax=Marinomonas piezotolerans TaxID=2213058 RepID=A0A370U4D9_9GAMM|nr:integration host factor subunit alpha [Marinomonas piezotolerans]RDL42603.1 integration host factor subunit alpha [Marinomonas piezotolerans]
MASLTKADIAENLVDSMGLSKKDAKDLVECFFDTVRETLVEREQVKLSGFGNFEVREKSQRPGRNPKTGEEIPITARTVVTFKPGQKLKTKVESYMQE